MERERDARARPLAWFEACESGEVETPRSVTVRVPRPGAARSVARATFEAKCDDDVDGALESERREKCSRLSDSAKGKRKEASVNTESWRSRRERATQARATCRRCVGNARALRDAREALRAMGAKVKEFEGESSDFGKARAVVAFGRKTRAPTARGADFRSTSVNGAERDAKGEEFLSVERAAGIFGSHARDMTSVQRRHARVTAVMARRSRERRAARAAAGVDEAPAVVGRGKPDWNDCVDLNASPRLKSSEEQMVLLRKLVAAKNREEEKMKAERLRDKRRRRLAALRAAAQAAREKFVSTTSTFKDEKLPMRVARSSFDSLRSFKSAVECVSAATSKMSMDDARP